MTKQERKGFTLVELLVFVAIFSVIIGAFITILVTVVRIQANQSVSGEVTQQSQFLIQQLQYYVSSARLIDEPQDLTTSTLVLREPVASSASDPITFSLASGTVYLQQGTSGAFTPLTSNKVTVSNLSFARHYSLSSSSPLGTDSVSYSFTMSGSTGLQSQYSESFRSSAVVATPVPEVALVQQAKAEDNAASNANLVKAFPSANEDGDLLLAVVAYQGTGTSSISDTEGNAWVQVATTTTMTPLGTVTVYEALNVAAGANTTTVSFASGDTYTSLFLYEYRSALPVSAFDVSGAQAQAATSAPTSPAVSPTSTTELLLGIDDNSTPTSATFSPGTGYTLETSSTAGNTTQVFVEDMNQYVTGAVSAPWTSSVFTSSTAMIVTFKANGAAYTYDNGMVGHWTMNEGTGAIAYDSSGNGDNGIWTGNYASPSSTYYTTGKVGPYAAYFDGSTDYVSMSSTAITNFGAGSFTVSAWVKPTSSLASYYEIAGKKLTYNGSNIGWDLWLDYRTVGVMELRINDGSTANDLTPQPSVNLTAPLNGTSWAFLTFVVNVGNNVTFYLNGINEGSQSISTMTGSISNSQPITVGALGGGNYFPALVDDVRMYNRALSTAEILALYNSQK